MNTRALHCFVAAILLHAGFSAPAIAETACQGDLDLIDQNATSTAPVAPDTLMEVIRLRNLGQAECESGDTSQGLARLAEAKALLGL